MCTLKHHVLPSIYQKRVHLHAKWVSHYYPVNKLVCVFRSLTRHHVKLHENSNRLLPSLATHTTCYSGSVSCRICTGRGCLIAIYLFAPLAHSEYIQIWIQTQRRDIRIIRRPSNKCAPRKVPPRATHFTHKHTHFTHTNKSISLIFAHKHLIQWNKVKMLSEFGGKRVSTF